MVARLTCVSVSACSWLHVYASFDFRRSGLANVRKCARLGLKTQKKCVA